MFGFFDRTPSGKIHTVSAAGFNGFHTTTVNGSGEPTVKDMLAVADDIGLARQRATAIIDEIEDKTGSFRP